MEDWCIMIQMFMKQDSAKKNMEIDRQKRGIPVCIAAANRIIDRTNAQNEWRIAENKTSVKLTGKRLQKILYLCQLFWLIDHDDSEMITEDFEAWPNGPVIREIYDYFSVYQDGDMFPYIKAGSRPLTVEERKLINIVVDYTIDIPTEKIIEYTHSPGSPWHQVYNEGRGLRARISQTRIRAYIREQKHQEELLRLIQCG